MFKVQKSFAVTGNIHRSRSPFAFYMKEALSQYQLYLLLFLPIAYMIIFNYGPMYGIQIAFKDFIATKGIEGSPWVGMKYFIKFFESPAFSQTIINTVALSVYSIAAGFPIPILLALALNNTLHQRFKKAVQMVVYAPHFISVVVLVGIMYQFLSPKYGFVNSLMGLLGVEPIMFMGSEKWFRHLYVWSGIWQNMGWGCIIYLSALSSADMELHEAAIIDGAGRFKRMVYIDIPVMVPTIITLLILSTGSIMSVGFEKVLLMQNAVNLGVSEIISTYLYKRSFESTLPNYSYSSAIGLFNSLVNFAILLVVNKIAKKYSDYSLW